MKAVAKIWNFLNDRASAGSTLIALRGPRRCSKTWTISQFLLRQMFDYGDKVVFASMTEAQGDAGVFDDCKNILSTEPAWSRYLTITQSPRTIKARFTRDGRSGQCLFRSFKDPETAKGIACDWVFMNEANKFSLQQFYDLSANARKGVIVDFNPNKHFWLEDVLKPEDELHVKWTWNKDNLTPAQIKWFADVTARAKSPNATAADKYYYDVYVLGEYAELLGNIFTPANIRREKIDLAGMTNYFIYGDPSAMCGADYFALILCAVRDGILYVVDMWSRNVGSSADAADKIAEWCGQYDVREIVIETNGHIGQTFYEKQRGSFPRMKPYTNSDNKHGRIMGNYEDICTKVVFNAEAGECDTYCGQIYEYEGKNSANSHDDNIDAVNSAWETAHRRYRVV